MKLIIDIPDWYYKETLEFLHPILVDKAIIKGIPFESFVEGIKSEIHENAEMQSDGEWYLNEKWIMEIIDKHMGEKE